MFEVDKSEVRKGDLVILDSGRKVRVRDVGDKLICCDGDTRRRRVIEIGLGERLFLSDIIKVLRRYQPGDWRAA